MNGCENFVYSGTFGGRHFVLQHSLSLKAHPPISVSVSMLFFFKQRKAEAAHAKLAKLGISLPGGKVSVQQIH